VLNLQNVVEIEVGGIDDADYPDYCDAFISSAVWKDTGEALSDTEIEELNEDHDFVYEQVWKEIH
jgi:hypothetical protein